MKAIPSASALLALALISSMLTPAKGAILVSNVWNTGIRSYPAFDDPNSPYSEMGTDYNGSGDFESAWFFTGSSGTAMTASPGHLHTTVASGSSSWTSYFTTESNPIALSGAGDQLKLVWVFTPSGVSSTSTSSSGLRVAVVDSPAAARLTSDGSPGSSTYAGYALFMNMATTLGSSSSFQLMDRGAPSTSSALLSSSGSWNTLTNGAGKNVTGYADGVTYTLAMTFTRNADDGLDITVTMTGGSLNNTGSISVAYTDPAPNTFTFDTFGVRPSSATDSATDFDTTLFEAEFIPGATAPSVSIDPQDTEALAGQDATFNVVASGTLPLNYQWYFNTNTLLVDATDSTLTLTNVQPANAGWYFAVVTNNYGSATSAVAQLTVNLPVKPTITMQPLNQTNISPGGTATFSVMASGTEPFNYQWYFNTNTLLTNATDSTLILHGVQPSDAGLYSVEVSNLAGTTNSSFALLTVNTNPVAPSFTTQPSSQVVLIGGVASFTATAAGTAPIGYQWRKNGSTIVGANDFTLNVTNVQIADSGSSFTVVATNSVGSVTSSPAILTVTTEVPLANSAYDVAGFGQYTTGGGVIPESDPAYRKVTNALDFANAILSANKVAGSVKVIEITTNLDLGWNEIGSEVQNLSSSPFREHTTPLMHPRLLQTGVSLIDIKPKSGLTIFSENGATIRHATFNIKGTENIIVRNLKFDEMWEWDEATKGQYDRNDWDFIDLGNGGSVSNIWIDHCTFTKAYDGILDTKAGSSGITISWCKYMGDDGATNTNSWVWQQINALEATLSSGTNKFYSFLRNNGFSTTNIVAILQGHDKTHLAGANSLDSKNATITMTFHHLWLNSVWDRCVPRLRAGNVHDYNLYVDDSAVLAAKRLRNSIATTMSTANQNTLNNTYDFNPPINGAISTENGALLVEKSVYRDCVWPLRNNQTDPSNPEYTGKIEARDCIYQFDDTTVRGNSTDAGNPMGPFQAPIIPFSWNLPGNGLPYTYTADDPSQLEAIVTSSTAGAGSGVLHWDKTNWLMTVYPPTKPFIVVEPNNTSANAGQDVVFTVVAGGTTPLAYQWFVNTNTAIAGATNSSLTLQDIQTTNAGTYSVTITNVAGSVGSTNATLTITSIGSAQPQITNPVFNQGSLQLTIAGESGKDYIVQASTNLVDWVGVFTNHAATSPFDWIDANSSNYIQRFYRILMAPAAP